MLYADYCRIVYFNCLQDCAYAAFARHKVPIAHTVHIPPPNKFQLTMNFCEQAKYFRSSWLTHIVLNCNKRKVLSMIAIELLQ